MGEDAIKRQHQIRIRYIAYIRSLQSLEKQKLNQAKYEVIKSDRNISNIIDNVNKTRQQKQTRNVSFKETNYMIKKEKQVEKKIKLKKKLKMKLVYNSLQFVSISKKK